MATIPLTHGKVALVDDADFEYMNQWKWHLTYQGYAARTQHTKNPEHTKTILMHRVVMPDKFVDHINGDKLNNQRSNLRYCTYSENLRNRAILSHNTSGYKGVSKFYERWRTRLTIHGKTLYTLHDTKEEAALAYNQMALKYHGEFALLNEVVL